jgi:hypothetical protein
LWEDWQLAKRDRSKRSSRDSSCKKIDSWKTDNSKSGSRDSSCQRAGSWKEEGATAAAGTATVRGLAAGK